MAGFIIGLVIGGMLGLVVAGVYGSDDNFFGNKEGKEDKDE